MEPYRLELEREKRIKQALERHSRLAKLFKEDRFSFERERRRLIDEVIDSAGNEEQKARLREIQEDWNRKMKGAGSQHNRLVLAKAFFWEHFHEVWQPFIQEANRTLSGLTE
jgi:hypothetical protein